VTSLRASYELPASPDELIVDAYRPDLGSAAGALVARLVAAQKQALIDQRLIGYLVGRDVAIDAGDKLDPPIISQPDRVTFEDLVANPQLEGEVTDKLAALDDYGAALAAFDRELGALDLPDNRWSRELRDGVAVDYLRTEFVRANYGAVLAHLHGDAAAANQAYERAKARLADAREHIIARHADLHDTHRRRLVDKTPNVTFYQFGYLYMADTLCYWQRELDQVGAIVGSSTAIPKSCLF